MSSGIVELNATVGKDVDVIVNGVGGNSVVVVTFPHAYNRKMENKIMTLKPFFLFITTP